MASSKLIAATCSLLLSATAALAASLQVEPALVEVAAPGAASTVTLRNSGDAPINVQIRVFRWSQENGKERLDPTSDVVASPPAATLAANGDYVARLVRVAKRPIEREESYRLLIDELPSAAKAKAGTIRLLVRHSIPAFFTAPDVTPPAVTWSVARQRGQLLVSARNRGDTRLRVSALTLRDGAGRKMSFGKGLVGYALGGSTMTWLAPAGGRRFGANGPVSISASGNEGAINAVAPAVSDK